MRRKIIIVLTITFMVTVMVTAFSYLYISQILRQRINNAYESASRLTQQLAYFAENDLPDLRNSNVNRAEGSSIERKRKADVVNRGGLIDQTKLFAEARRRHRVEIRPGRNLSADELLVRIEKRFAVRVNDRNIVDIRPKISIRFQIVEKICIHRQVLG